MIKQLEEFLKSDHWLRRYCIFSGGVFYFEPPCISVGLALDLSVCLSVSVFLSVAHSVCVSLSLSLWHSWYDGRCCVMAHMSSQGLVISCSMARCCTFAPWSCLPTLHAVWRRPSPSLFATTAFDDSHNSNLGGSVRAGEICRFCYGTGAYSPRPLFCAQPARGCGR